MLMTMPGVLLPTSRHNNKRAGFEGLSSIHDDARAPLLPVRDDACFPEPSMCMLLWKKSVQQVSSWRGTDSSGHRSVCHCLQPQLQQLLLMRDGHLRWCSEDRDRAMVMMPWPPCWVSAGFKRFDHESQGGASSSSERASTASEAASSILSVYRHGAADTSAPHAGTRVITTHHQKTHSYHCQVILWMALIG